MALGTLALSSGVAAAQSLPMPEVVQSMSGHSLLVATVAYSPDGNTLASGAWDNTVKLWDTQTGKLLQTIEGHSSVVVSLVFTPDGKQLAVGTGRPELANTITVYGFKDSRYSFNTSTNPK